MISITTKRHFHLLTLLLLTFFGRSAFGQPLVTIPNTVEIALKSEHTKRNYNLQIALPYNYEKDTKDYPTVYLLDANNDFPLLTSISRRLEAEDDLKKFIIVGISYQETPWIHRFGDYSHAKIINREQSGGAEIFSKMIQEELIPLIEDKYRVKNQNRTLAGHSLGGLFASYLIINNSQIFNNYIVSSPSLWVDDYSVLNTEQSSYSKKSIFISIGALENPHMKESTKMLSDFVDRKLSLSSKKLVSLDGENHASAKFRAYADGLRWLFK